IVMSIRPELRHELLTLSPEDRQELADELYESLVEASLDPEWEREGSKEIEERMKDVAENRVEQIAADEVHRELRAELRDAGRGRTLAPRAQPRRAISDRLLHRRPRLGTRGRRFGDTLALPLGGLASCCRERRCDLLARRGVELDRAIELEQQRRLGIAGLLQP